MLDFRIQSKRDWQPPTYLLSNFFVERIRTESESDKKNRDRKEANKQQRKHPHAACCSLSLSLSSSIYLSVYLSIHLSFSVCLLFSGDFTVSVQQSWIFRLTKYACADNSIVKATDIHTSLSLSIYIYVYVSHGTYETQIHKTILCIYVYMSSALPFRISDKRMAKQRDDSRDN